MIEIGFPKFLLKKLDNVWKLEIARNLGTNPAWLSNYIRYVETMCQL